MSEHPEQFNSAEETEDFKDKKRKYFVNLGLQTRDMLKMHKAFGLWGEKNSKEDWRNVSEHCLAEAARAEVLAEKLKLSEKVKKSLKLAAVLHDFNKRKDIEETKDALQSEKLMWPVLEKQAQKELKDMRKFGIDEDIIYIKERASGERWSIAPVIEILNKQEPLSDMDIACLIMHNVDDYTIGDKWAVPAEITPGHGKINALDRRVDKNEANPNYKKLDEEGRGWFKEGETVHQLQRRIGHLVENRLAELLKERSEVEIDPLDLPEFVDNEIREKIEAIKE